MSRIHRSRAGNEEGETERVGGWMSLRSAPLDCLLFRPSETVPSGPSHGIKASLWEVINSSPVLPKGWVWWVHFGTRLLHEELSVTAHPGAGPKRFPHSLTSVCFGPQSGCQATSLQHCGPLSGPCNSTRCSHETTFHIVTLSVQEKEISPT